VSIAEYLQHLRTTGIHVTSEGGALRVSARQGALTSDIREQLAARKQEILDFLALAARLGNQQTALVPLQPLGSGSPFFGIAGHNGDVFCYRWLSRAMGTKSPFFGLQPPGYGSNDKPLEDIGQLAEYFARQIGASGLGNSCSLIGYCAGGTVAFELTRRLIDRGFTIQRLVLIGSPHSSWYGPIPQAWARLRMRSQSFCRRLAQAVEQRDVRPITAALAAGFRAMARKPSRDEQRIEDRVRRQVEKATLKAVAAYVPSETQVPTSLVLPGIYVVQTRRSLLRWRAVTPNCEILQASADISNDTMLLEPHAGSIARLLVHDD
jgi:thioesterase domain-containing protein